MLQFFTLVFSACLDSIRSTFAANVRVQFQTPCPLKHSNHIWRRFPSLVRFLPIFGDECKPVLVCWGNPPLFWKFEALAKHFTALFLQMIQMYFPAKNFFRFRARFLKLDILSTFEKFLCFNACQFLDTSCVKTTIKYIRRVCHIAIILNTSCFVRTFSSHRRQDYFFKSRLRSNKSFESIFKQTDWSFARRLN